MAGLWGEDQANSVIMDEEGVWSDEEEGGVKEEVSRRAGLTSVVRRGGWEMAGLPKLDSIAQVRSLSLSPELL